MNKEANTTGTVFTGSSSLANTVKQVMAKCPDHGLTINLVKAELKEIRTSQGLEDWTTTAIYYVDKVLHGPKGNEKDLFNLAGSDKENALALRDRIIEIATPASETEGALVTLADKLNEQREKFSGLMERAEGDIGKVISVLAGNQDVWPSRKLKDGSIKPVGFNAVGSAIRPNDANGDKNKEYQATWDQRYRPIFKGLESARNAFAYLKSKQAEATKAAEEKAHEEALNSDNPKEVEAAKAKEAEAEFTRNLGKIGRALKSATTVISESLDVVSYDVETFVLKVENDHKDAITSLVEELSRLVPVERLLVREKEAQDADTSDPTEEVETD